MDSSQVGGRKKTKCERFFDPPRRGFLGDDVPRVRNSKLVQAVQTFAVGGDQKTSRVWDPE